MIPTDLAARLRLLSESIVNPVSPVREVSAELPELPVGQRFVARIENALSDGTFRALVAGRSLALALPQTIQAHAGDTLDLVVTAHTPRLIIAQGADETAARQSRTAASAPAPTPVPAPSLSRAGQIISTLLSGEMHAPQPALISRTAPLLAAPAAQASELVPALKALVVESGLFYESHQAQWIAGRYPTEALAREPQSRLARQPGASNAAALPAKPAEAAHAAASAADGEPAAGRVPAATAPALPAELQSHVQQQLDAAATQHIVWRGDIWPGQALHWEIEADEHRQDDAGEAPAEHWTTSLGLTLPTLGQVNVVLQLTPLKVSLAMTASTGADILQQGLHELAASFAAAGLPPLAAVVETHEPA